MPYLEEVVLRPEEGHNGPGLSLDKLRRLAGLRRLIRLEAQISTEDSINNMPEFVYVLRDFHSLRYLTVSWGKTPPEVNSGRKLKLMEWLENALQAENVNLHIQISHSLHSSLYTNPPSD